MSEAPSMEELTSIYHPTACTVHLSFEYFPMKSHTHTYPHLTMHQIHFEYIKKRVYRIKHI